MREDEDSEEIEDSFNLVIGSRLRGDYSEKHLDRMSGRAHIIDLDWYPEMYEDCEEEVQIDRETFDFQNMAYMCLCKMEDLREDPEFEKMQWSEELVGTSLLLFPIRIGLTKGKYGRHLRFWGYLCQFPPDTDGPEVRKCSLPLPSALAMKVGVYDSDFMQTQYDPLEDPIILMIYTNYHGLREFEVDGEMRKYHWFWQTKVLEGHRS